jgi:hypothetical protein
MSIASFNPFSLGNNSHHVLTGIRIQEIIDYAESRFRAILTNISHEKEKTESDRKKWVQGLLHLELVNIKA